MCKMAHFGNCDPETVDQEYCIFHKPNKSEEEAVEFYRKFLERFKPRIEEIEVDGRKIKRFVFENPVDARGFVFPKIPNKAVEYKDNEGNLWENNFSLKFAIFKFGVYFSETMFEGNITFYKTHFYLRVIFDGATFHGISNFKDALFFGEISLAEVKFMKEVQFIGTIFRGDLPFVDSTEIYPSFDITFEGSLFYGTANFKKANFKGGIVHFKDLAFHNNLNFEEAEFLSGVSFEHLEVKGIVNFYKTRFKNDVIFSDVTFRDHVYFRDNEAKGFIIFENVNFFNAVLFEHNSLGPIEFDNVTFNGAFSFAGNTKLESSIHIVHVIFRDRAIFQQVVFDGDVIFEHTEFYNYVSFINVKFRGNVNFSSVNFKKRSLFYVDFEEYSTKPAKTFIYENNVLGEVTFNRCTFEDDVSFEGSNFFKRSVLFIETIFKGDAFFMGIILVGHIIFRNIKAHGTVSFDGAIFGGTLTFEYSRFRETLLLTHTTFGVVPPLMKIISDETNPLLVEIESSYCELNFNSCNFESWVDFGFGGDIKEFEYRFSPNNPQPLKEASKVQRIAYEHMGEREKADLMFVLEMRAKRKLRMLQAKENFTNAKDFKNKLKATISYIGTWIGVQTEKILADWITEYGTSWRKILTSSAAVTFGTAISYTIWGHYIEGFPTDASFPLRFANALYYSLVTFTTLGYGDMHPTGWLKALSAIEALTGAVFMALIVAVIARKWMR